MIDKDDTITKVHLHTLDAIARRMLGTPYRHLGRNEKGLDCWGAVLLFFKEIGILLKDPVAKYDPEWFYEANYIEEKVNTELKDDFIRVEHPRAGDVVVIQSKRANVVDHLAVYLGNGTILNTDRFVGIHMMKVYGISEMVRGYYRYKDLEVI